MSVSITEKVRNYITDCQTQKILKPGERLPSVAQLCEVCHGSYASIHKALKTLESEGLIEMLHGRGTFLTGVKRLKIDFMMECGGFYPLQEFQDALNKELERRQLFLEVNLRDFVVEEYVTPVIDDNTRFTVITCSDWQVIPGNIMDYSKFSDYAEVSGCLRSLSSGFYNYEIPFYNYEIPFYLYLYQPAVNPEILKRIGFPATPEFSTLDWWDDYVRASQAHGLCPASEQWLVPSWWSFQTVFTRLVPLLLNEKKSYTHLFQGGVFNTRSGKRGLEIMKSHTLTPQPFGGFYSGTEGINLSVGSWISRQLGRKFPLTPEELRIVANRVDGRKICQHRVFSLRTFMHPGVSIDEERRVWEFIKVLVSKKIQLELARSLGCMSVRNDVTPEEHPWVTRPDYLEFFPGKDDRSIPVNLIPDRIIGSLATLFERYKFYDEDLDNIARCMDEKLFGMRWNY